MHLSPRLMRRWPLALSLVAFASSARALLLPSTPAQRGPYPIAPTNPSASATSPPSSSPKILAAAVEPDVASSHPAAVLGFYAKLDSLYDRSSAIRCPFFRRRAADVVDGAAMVVRFLLIRHKSLPGVSDLFLGGDPADGGVGALSACVPGCKPLGRHIRRHADGTARKARGLPLGEISERICQDWTGGTAGESKGYYITGGLDSTIYRDDCLFTGPDPDMPVRGLRKYLSAAAHLFDPRESDAELLSIRSHDDGGVNGTVEVKWRLGGIIQLPWRPAAEPWTGTTVYHLDEEGLIYLHEESWNISAWRAFICTLYPQAKGWRIWDAERTAIHDCGSM